jgi:hypothetical protein
MSPLIPCLIWAGCLLTGAALAQSPVTVKLGTQPAGPGIPADFVGLSFGTKTLPPDKLGGHFFSGTNTALITLFHTMGRQ